MLNASALFSKYGPWSPDIKANISNQAFFRHPVFFIRKASTLIYHRTNQTATWSIITQRSEISSILLYIKRNNQSFPGRVSQSPGEEKLSGKNTTFLDSYCKITRELPTKVTAKFQVKKVKSYYLFYLRYQIQDILPPGPLQSDPHSPPYHKFTHVFTLFWKIIIYLKCM